MAFNPFTEKGTSLDKQWDPYSKVTTQPYKIDQVDPYTRARIIAGFGLEYAGWLFYHVFAQHTDNDELKGYLAEIRRTEDQHRSQFGFTFDPDASVLEHTIAVEQMEISLTATAAKDEPDQHVKNFFDYIILDDLDHLYRYSQLLQLKEGKNANDILKGSAEVKPGRPTWLQHLHPLDTIPSFYDAHKVDPLTRVHALTILAIQQQARLSYFNHGFQNKDHEARELFAEIGEVEEQHITQVESLMDPHASWLEMAVFHEYDCCWYYQSFIESETDQRIRKIYEDHLSDELTHLQIWSKMLKKYEGKDAEQTWPTNLPKLLTLEPAKDYINHLLSTQVNLREDGKNLVMRDQLPGTWKSYSYHRDVDIQNAPSTHFLAQGEQLNIQQKAA